ncbi:hypothetical protein K1719_017356 [Acacia pycnantha]|nr:hypothetical protein K1719_017356 [Acacia pycnantha]
MDPLFLSFLLALAIIIAMVLILSLPSSSSFKNSISILHQVPKGHVAVYWTGGALQKTITEPGFHIKMPFITRYELVTVTLGHMRSILRRYKL